MKLIVLRDENARFFQKAIGKSGMSWAEVGSS